MNNIQWLNDNVDLAKKATRLREIDDTLIDKVILLNKVIKKEKMMLENNLHQINLISKKANWTNEQKKGKVIELKRINKKINNELKRSLSEFNELMNNLPNLQLSDIENVSYFSKPFIIKKVKNLSVHTPKTLPHWDIYKIKKLVNFEWGVNVGGSRLVAYVNEGAKLRRAIMDFQIDLAKKNGYIEIFPPVLATSESLYNSAHLPKFQKDVFYIEKDKLYLTPTAETSICNFYKNKILKTSDLPLRFSATTLNFRSEVGSAGIDVRGCHRMKQFTKTELFSFCSKKDGEKEFQKMLTSTESVLNALKITYEIVRLPHKEIAFGAQKTIDFNIWMPGENTYKEISSVSLIGDFQSRRARIRHREKISEKTSFCYTLNGTGVAVDRLMACIVESFYDQQKNIIMIPDILVPYYGSNTI